jgi:hypothetical protein
MKRVKCKSGIEGWQERLKFLYADFAEFKHYADLYKLHKKLGYRTPKAAWDNNPLVEGSVNPSDYRKVKE